MSRLGAEPWGMGEAEYLSAVGRARVCFAGSVADTPWDPGLARAMRARRRAVFEEDVRGTLLGCASTTGGQM